MSVNVYSERMYDLIVVGGGMTGVAAAVAAKRQGLSVLILEKAGSLGGAAVTCLINPFMPYFTKVDGSRFDLSRGFFAEMKQRFYSIGAQNGQNEDLHEEFIKVAFDRLTVDEGIDVLFHAYLCGAETKDGKITCVKVATKGGVIAFQARTYVDATGDANLSMLAGVPFRLGRKDHLCQPMTLCFRIGNVDTEQLKHDSGYMQKLYKQFQAEGKIKNPREDILYFSTLVNGMVHFNTTRIVKLDPTDPLDVTRAEMAAREQMLEIYTFLRENIPAFKNSSLLYSAGEIGVRESRMIDGEYVLTEDDLRECKKFEDRIAAGNYDIDIHNPEGSGTSHYYFKPGTWYTIPYRSLIPQKISNLAVAGRCISCTHEAQASIRIMPIVTTLGEAAGVGCAVACKSGCALKDTDIGEIQKILQENGAFIG